MNIQTRKLISWISKFDFMLVLIIAWLSVSFIGIQLVEAGEVELKPPLIEAQGAILIEAQSGRVLYEKNSHELLAMASTTKIMTALVVLENTNLDDVVIVSKKAAGTPPVKMGLQTDEKITMRTLLYALMLQSSNDAAVAIAEHIGGDVETFCEIMTAKAKELGAIDTEFRTPNGLDAESHYSTAYDLGQIARYALQNEVFVRIIASPNYQEASSHQTHYITNKNRFLNEFSGAQGIKTGYTGEAGHCFVGAATQDGMQLISVVLASGWGTVGREQKWVDTKRLMNFGFSNYQMEPLFLVEESEEVTALVGRAKEKDISLLYTDDIIWPLAVGENENLQVRIELVEDIQAPIMEGDKLGEAIFYVGDEFVKKIPLIAKDTILRHDFKTSLEKTISSLFSLTSETAEEIMLPE